jgi:hypothetical protein
VQFLRGPTGLWLMRIEDLLRSPVRTSSAREGRGGGGGARPSLLSPLSSLLGVSRGESGAAIGAVRPSLLGANQGLP